jgi:hypothetical protein
VQWRYFISRQNVTLDPASLAAAPSLFQSLNSHLVGVVRAQGGYISPAMAAIRCRRSGTQKGRSLAGEAVQKQHVAIFVNV